MLSYKHFISCIPIDISKENRSEVIRKGKSAPLNDNSAPLSPASVLTNRIKRLIVST